MPVAAVEIEVSLQAYGKQTKDGSTPFPFPTVSWEAHLLLSDCHL
jgi:hypothetical protein